MTTETESSSGVSHIRRMAEGRQFALRRSDPAIGNVSAGAFWAIWRDGVNYALTSSAKMSTLFSEVGSWILVMAEARDAAPATCERCGGVIE